MRPRSNRRTKIVATIGPASGDARTLERLIDAGVDCARVNCSHASRDQLREQAAAVRAAAKRVGRPVALLVDLQGPKLRLATDTVPRPLVPGDAVTLAGVAPGAQAPDGAVAVALPDFAALVSADSEIVVGDGLPRLEVTAVEPPLVHARATSAGPLSPGKGVFVTHARPLLPALTEKDRADLETAIELDADFVALSFVRSAADVLELRKLLDAAGSRARVVAKIEKVEAFERLDGILDVADGIMIARGDYGVEAGVEHVPPMQKDAIRRAAVLGKLTITATQMLESMIASAEPTRAEVADVANAVLDGTSAVMLSAETGIGAHPVEAVRRMAQIAAVAERASGITAGAPRAGRSTEEVVMRAAVLLAEDVGAEAIVVPAATGATARACARHRPSVPVVALLDDPRTASQLALEWGVLPVLLDEQPPPEQVAGLAVARARRELGLAADARVVVTTGASGAVAGATNLVAVLEAA